MPELDPARVGRWAQIHRAKRAAKRARKTKGSSRAAARGAKTASPAPGRLAALDLSDDLVTVSVPAWRTPPALLERAIRSVLSGSHRHVRVVAISDGEPSPCWKGLPPELLDDPRLICVASPSNWGPYFLHDVVLRAAPGPWFAVQDSDDASHARRFEQLMRTIHRKGKEAAHTHLVQYEIGGKRHVLRGSAAAQDAWAHRANHFGLYSRSTLLALGGYHAGFRVGYDTNLTSFLNLLASTTMSDGALYTRYKRKESLTRASRTGHGSRLRTRQKAALRRMWNETVRRNRTSRSSAASYVRKTALARAKAHGDPSLRDRLVEEVSSQLQAVSIPIPPANPDLVGRVIRGASVSPWAVKPALAREIFRRCEREQPKVVLDVGSGLSTAVFALLASRYGTRVISLEHDASWLERTRTILRRMGLDGAVELIHAPLKTTRAGVWYHVDLRRLLGKARIDCVLIDGPPVSEGGRSAALAMLRDWLAPGATIWLHDAARSGEQSAVSEWSRKGWVGNYTLETTLDPRGLGVMEFVP